MVRKIIIIDSEKCDGCGACVEACHEGAIGLHHGKAVLLRDDYCDGLGDCLPACPTAAIRFEEREALPYDEAAVLVNMARAQKKSSPGCPGTMSRVLPQRGSRSSDTIPGLSGGEVDGSPSELSQWPVQLQLVPTNAPWLSGAHLLIAADCTAFAYGSFHSEFMRGKKTIIGCPKLDNTDYAHKLTRILQENQIAGIHSVLMSVPCCRGLEHAVNTAITTAGWQGLRTTSVISPEGAILDSE